MNTPGYSNVSASHLFRISVAAGILLLALASPAHAVIVGGGGTGGPPTGMSSVPIDTRVGDFWNWGASLPPAPNALEDPTGEFLSVSQGPGIFYVTTVFQPMGSGQLNRAYTVPAFTPIFASLISLVYVNSDLPGTPEDDRLPASEVEQFVHENIDLVSLDSTFVQLIGGGSTTTLDDPSETALLRKGSGNFTVIVPAGGNGLGPEDEFPPGSFPNSFAEGYFYSLDDGLPPGEYTLQLFQTLPDFGLEISSLDTITVVPIPTAMWLFGSALALLGWVRRKAA